MSDMNTPEVPADVPVEPTAAPEVPADAPEAGQVTPEPTPNPVAASDPVPVLARTASSESETQQPESAPEVEEEPVSLEDAARVLLIYVKAHRTAGDADLEAAVADVEAALAAQA